MLRILVLIAMAIGAQKSAYDDVRLPEPARRFITDGTRPIVFEVADLNRDGRLDAILVIETTPAAKEDVRGRERTLLILVGRPDGSFRERARNSAVVLCSRCGGMRGEPFQGVDVGPGTFTDINIAAGPLTGLRYTIGYSRRDDTWQLTRVEEQPLPIGASARQKATVSTPPKDFGRIDIADFDPENWEGRGPR